LRRYRFLLRSLVARLEGVEARELFALATNRSMSCSLAGFVDPEHHAVSHGISAENRRFFDGHQLVLLGVVIVAAASLPMFVVRALHVLASARAGTAEVMREVVEEADLHGVIAQARTAAFGGRVTTPVVFLVFGCALIVSSICDAPTERSREETAAFWPGRRWNCGRVVPGAGLEACHRARQSAGFTATVRGQTDGYRVERGDDGIVTVVTRSTKAALRCARGFPWSHAGALPSCSWLCSAPVIASGSA